MTNDIQTYNSCSYCNTNQINEISGVGGGSQTNNFNNNTQFENSLFQDTDLASLLNSLTTSLKGSNSSEDVDKGVDSSRGMNAPDEIKAMWESGECPSRPDNFGGGRPESAGQNAPGEIKAMRESGERPSRPDNFGGGCRERAGK